MMDNYTTINGITFCTSKAHQRIAGEQKKYYRDSYNSRSLWDAYDRPSRTKKLIYEEWERDLDRFENHSALDVMSHSSSAFTLGFYFSHEGKRYFAYITKDYNRLCEVESEG